MTGSPPRCWSAASAHAPSLANTRVGCWYLDPFVNPSLVHPERPCLTRFGPTHASGLLSVQLLPLPVGPPGHESAYPKVAAPLQPVPSAAAHQTVQRHCLETLGPCETPALQREDRQSLGVASTHLLPSLRPVQGISAATAHIPIAHQWLLEDTPLPLSPIPVLFYNPGMLVQAIPWPSLSRKFSFIFLPILWLCQIPL